jgi:AcrR family transcriptional regulator
VNDTKAGLRQYSRISVLMGRRVRHTPGHLLDVTLRLLAAGRPETVTIAAVVAGSGAPAGSIYHRFGSREGLLAATWNRAAADFQSAFLAALAADTADPGRTAVEAVLAWSRRQPDGARLLVLRQPRDLGLSRWPAPERERLRQLAREFEAGIDSFCQARLGSRGGEPRRRATFALLDLPYAALRRYLAAGMAPPPEVDRYLDEALGALLGSGRPGPRQN